VFIKQETILSIDTPAIDIEWIIGESFE